MQTSSEPRQKPDLGHLLNPDSSPPHPFTQSNQPYPGQHGANRDSYNSRNDEWSSSTLPHPQARLHEIEYSYRQHQTYVPPVYHTPPPPLSNVWRGPPPAGLSDIAPAMTNGYTQQQRGFHSSHAYGSGDPSLHSVSGLQSTERVSVRLAARTTDPMFYTGYRETPESRTEYGETAESRKHFVFPVNADGQAIHERIIKRRKLDVPGPPPTSKRGYNAKRRSETAQNLAQTAQMATLSYTNSGDGTAAGNSTTLHATEENAVSLRPEIQVSRCMSNKYKSEDVPKCVSCTRRWQGDTCRFLGIRIFLKDKSRKTVGVSFLEVKDDTSKTMQFQKQWNIPMLSEYVKRTKLVTARALLPLLLKEQEHIKQEEVIGRPRESELRATCDTCMTSLFGCSWMCRLCGRETCAECFAKTRELTEEEGVDREEVELKRVQYGRGNPFFLSCTKRNDHRYQDFCPVSRFQRAELNEAVAKMQALVNAENALSTQEISDPTERNDPRRTPEPEPVRIEYYTNSLFGALPGLPALRPDISPESYGYPSTADIPAPPSREIRRYPNAELSLEQFPRIWSRGEPILVTDGGKALTETWTPQHFINKFGDQSCLIVECQNDKNKKISVAEFFSQFGKFDDREDCWKLKDWPPSMDFKSAFPVHYKEFSKVVPVPSYVRRDGVLNIASHFPENSLAPDLGPKMYNAMASDTKTGSKGSTRLHMDIADAVNIMTYTSLRPDGKPGCAVWDLFRAEDSDAIRAFLRRRCPVKDGNPNVGQDPIHSQQHYLDDQLIAELYRDTGVHSYRVYQKPGEAIFIPAGAAHQVCNLSDCIKVAIDFVSPENISRCEKLTTEFREQNSSIAWKEDVLQLRTMMWFAWLSCQRLEEEAQD